MQTPEFIPQEPYADEEPYAPAHQRAAAFFPGLGERLTWLSGLVLMLSSLMGWYTGSGQGLHISVIGWHSSPLGKLVFFVGFALVVVAVMREFGIELPRAVPESLVVIVLGALATIFVLIRLRWIPDAVLPASGRGVGLYVSLAAALAAIAAGVVRASEED